MLAVTASDWLSIVLDLDGALAPSGLSAEQTRRVLLDLGVPLSTPHLNRLSPSRRAQEFQAALYGVLALSVVPSDEARLEDHLVSGVLKARRGRPLVLALVYGALAAQAGVLLEWVDFPGHALVRLVDERKAAGVDRSVLVDAATGAALDRQMLRELAEAATGHPDFDPGRLAPVPAQRIIRLWLLELRAFVQHRKDWPRLLIVLSALIQQGDANSAVFRDRARAFRALGAPLAAQADFEAYLRAVPASSDRRAVEAELKQLKGPRAVRPN